MYMRPAVKERPRTSQFASFPAPKSGWIANRNYAQPNEGQSQYGAFLLENFFPTAQGAMMRRGSQIYATLGDGTLPVTALFSYKNGNQEEFFGATENTIYDITTISNATNATIGIPEEDDELGDGLGNVFGFLSTDGLEEWEGLTGGDWVVTQFATVGGVFLVGVNGEDPMFIYDGQFFYPVEGTDVYTLPYDGGTSAFTVGQTVTGGTSGATARIVNIYGNEVSGTLIVDSISPTQWTLDYDAETANFTVGQTLTGGTSGATATIDSIVDNGTTGTLTISGLSGSFQDNETITDGAGGSATANGTETLLTGSPFQDNETLTDPLGGSALANGTGTIAFPGLTGVSTRSLSYVWSYKNRLYFVERDTLKFWYLAADAISGPASDFPLGGIFNRGGALLFGASWSLESGDGLAARNIFVSTEGEVAVYDGLFPADPSWALAGVYRIGRPMGKQAHIRAGGDLVIATDVGFLPLSVAIQRDYAALAPSAISFAIEDEWSRAVSERSLVQWRCEIWPSEKMVAVALPTVGGETPSWFVANARTGGWGLFTGWDATCLDVFRSQLYFGSADGRVVAANVTGQDEGKAYTASFVPLFDDLRSPGSLKVAKTARAAIRSPFPVRPKMSMQADFSIVLPPAPAAAPVISTSEWGTAIWGESVWGEARSPETLQQWQSVGGSGYALAASLQITSGALQPLDVEIVRTDLTVTAGDVMS